MSRLIDADSITEKIMNAFEETLRIALKSGTFDLEGVMLKIKCYLDNEPTAFDVDKVVEQLKKQVYEIDDSLSLSARDVIDEEDVMEIVKAGGIDERNT